MRRYIALIAIVSYGVLGVFDLCTGKPRLGSAEVLLSIVNALLLL